MVQLCVIGGEDALGTLQWAADQVAASWVD